MNLTVIGLNHKTAPIEIREQFYLNETQQELFLSELKNNPGVIEAFIFSTCNRIEVYLHLLRGSIGPEKIIELITTIKKSPQSISFMNHFYRYEGREAVKHLLKVAAGLDSLVLGEKQILGQIKIAFDRARNKGMFSKQFNLLSNIAIRTGKIARNETNICHGGSSISWAAIAKAESVLGSLQDRSLLIIGAGKMGDLAVEQISNKGFKNLFIMNRTQVNAQMIVEKYGGIAAGFCDIKEILSQVDICICCADAPHYIIEKDIAQKVMPQRQNRQLVFVDISMPRNIDPKVTEVDNVVLFKIDDLENVVAENMKKREEAILQVETIIQRKLSEFFEKLNKARNIDTEVTETVEQI